MATRFLKPGCVLSNERVERRLAAILAADVAGFSRMMGADEEGMLARLKAVRESGRSRHYRASRTCYYDRRRHAGRVRQRRRYSARCSAVWPSKISRYRGSNFASAPTSATSLACRGSPDPRSSLASAALLYFLGVVLFSTHIAEQEARHLSHLDLLAALGDAIAAMVAINVLERLVA